MNKNRKLIAWLAGLGLSFAALSAQAGNVGFSITYSDHDHRKKHSYYSYGYPGSYYKHHPYYGVKHYKYDRHYKKYDRHYKRHHYDRWYPKHYYDRYYYKQHKYDHYKHRFYDGYGYKSKHKYYGGHYHGNAYCTIRH